MTLEYFVGGPMIRKHDGALIGVISMGNANHQIFSSVPYYFNWISHKTGIKMPKVAGLQASVY